MLPAHGYPELKKYPHLAGNFGTAWQSQQKEFDNIPAPILFTTNCLMPQRPSYQDRVYTTSVVGYKGLTHITGDADGNKDFTPIIEHALRLGGYEHDHSMSGINGGHVLTTGFAHAAVLSHAEQIINSINQGHIRHIFLVGGCDGAHPGRNYYTDFVKQTPMDSLVLTLACGKYRFNDLDLGEIDGIPRILDMGQCNDSYSAIKVALALADAFDCSVNDLPLTLVLSWYEQKAVCILLTLLSLGIRNMYLDRPSRHLCQKPLSNILSTPTICSRSPHRSRIWMQSLKEADSIFLQKKRQVCHTVIYLSKCHNIKFKRNRKQSRPRHQHSQKLSTLHHT